MSPSYLEVSNKHLLSLGNCLIRPYWGYGQVRTLRGIHIGQIYWEVLNHLQSSKKIIILSEPFQNDKGLWKYEYTNWPLLKKETGSLFLKEEYCCDVGIHPYDNDLWNSQNWICRTWHRRRNIREVALIKSKLTTPSF